MQVLLSIWQNTYNFLIGMSKEMIKGLSNLGFGTQIIILQGSTKSNSIVAEKPFYDPNKALAKS